MTRLFWNASSSWGLVVLYYTQVYGAQVLLVTILSAVTVYRREMSCNHVYNADEDTTQSTGSNDGETKSSNDNPDDPSYEHGIPPSPTFWDDLFWDDLDRPLLAVFMDIFASFYFGTMRLQSGPDIRHPPYHINKRRRATSENEARSQRADFLTQELPPDLQVLVMSYLHPRDVVTFACASKASRKVVDYGETSMALWRTLWYRDYAWIVLNWEVGRQALHRSRQDTEEILFGKRFYFLFGQSYLNYVLAGQNSTAQCFVGLHGCIYDITSFLDSHPGSPENLLVHSGRDASSFFEDMGHSVFARKRSRQLCIVVDASCSDGDCGLCPTPNLSSSLCDLPRQVEGVATPLERSPPRRPSTLQSIRTEYDMQEQMHLRRVTRRFSGNPYVLGHVNVYYDPVCMEWKAWYTDMDLQTIFVNQI